MDYEIDLEIKDMKVNEEKLKDLRNVIDWFEERHKDSKERMHTTNELKSKVKKLELQIGNWI